MSNLKFMYWGMFFTVFPFNVKGIENNIKVEDGRSLRGWCWW